MNDMSSRWIILWINESLSFFLFFFISVVNTPLTRQHVFTGSEFCYLFRSYETNISRQESVTSVNLLHLYSWSGNQAAVPLDSATASFTLSSSYRSVNNKRTDFTGSKLLNQNFANTLITYKGFTVGTFNVRRFVEEVKQEFLTRDVDCFNIDVCCLQERKSEEITDINSFGKC